MVEVLQKEKLIFSQQSRDQNLSPSKSWHARGWPHKEVSLRGGKLEDPIEAVWTEKNEVLEKLSEVC